MAVDMFLKLGDIKGESRDQAHRDEIDITEWAWGLSQNGSMHSGTGGGAGKVDIANLNLKKPLDKSSPNLMMACASGKHYPEARLVVRKAGGSSPTAERTAGRRSLAGTFVRTSRREPLTVPDAANQMWELACLRWR
ncbi:type VI protein secretion system component Hcp [Pseudomonas tolaasii]